METKIVDYKYIIYLIEILSLGITFRSLIGQMSTKICQQISFLAMTGCMTAQACRLQRSLRDFSQVITHMTAIHVLKLTILFERIFKLYSQI